MIPPLNLNRVPATYVDSNEQPKPEDLPLEQLIGVSDNEGSARNGPILVDDNLDKGLVDQVEEVLSDIIQPDK